MRVLSISLSRFSLLKSTGEEVFGQQSVGMEPRNSFAGLELLLIMLICCLQGPEGEKGDKGERGNKGQKGIPGPQVLHHAPHVADTRVLLVSLHGACLLDLTVERWSQSARCGGGVVGYLTSAAGRVRWEFAVCAGQTANRAPWGNRAETAPTASVAKMANRVPRVPPDG